MLTSIFTSIAPAKINLYLHVNGVRQDGLHLLDSLFAFTCLGDQISLHEAPELGLNVTGYHKKDQLSFINNNIIIKTIKIVAHMLNRPPNLHVSLTKRLPIAAGLGGGSSNAATVLRLLTEIWPETRQLNMYEIAKMLGSDVSAFVPEKTALAVSGAGDTLDHVPTLPPLFVVLATPSYPVYTKDIFGRMRSTSPPKHCTQDPLTEQDFTSSSNFIKALTHRSNHLEPHAFELLPEIKTLKKDMIERQNCALARMSGSGGTVFGLFKDAPDADRAQVELKKIYPDYWVQATPLLTHFPSTTQESSCIKPIN